VCLVGVWQRHFETVACVSTVRRAENSDRRTVHTIFWEVIVLVILSKKKKKKKGVYVNVSYSERFPRFHCTVAKLLIRKGYYVLFLITIFIVQVTKLVQFTQYNTFSKIPLSTSMYLTTREDMARNSSGCNLTFLYARDNLHYLIRQFVSCIHFSSVHFTLHPTPYTNI